MDKNELKEALRDHRRAQSKEAVLIASGLVVLAAVMIGAVVLIVASR